ncbi:hypothetical protein A7E78_00175 [Syntrophotalea acetylenivorans]|uniref:Uncharacterized protein n=1 Tax=Syntrophotalea acetylenivorans TaxID=1842532 RepID=A0A1L3GKF9_9BACT|nr:hypothetical protein A7E78_00175 [Syntrophotalea acetylenivorans]
MFALVLIAWAEGWKGTVIIYPMTFFSVGRHGCYQPIIIDIRINILLISMRENGRLRYLGFLKE